MSVNNLFKRGNQFFSEQNHIEGLKVFKEIFLKYPKNTRLEFEINKKIKKFKQLIFETHSKVEIEEYFNLEKIGKISIVIQRLSNKLDKNKNDILTISLLGNFYASNKDYEKAIYFQKLAIQKAPFECAFYLNLSETLKKNNELDAALSILYFSKILSFRDPTIDYKIAKLNTNLKNFVEANLIYKELIRDKNVGREIIYSYCSNLIKLKKEKESIKFIKNYEKTHKTDEVLKSLIGLAYLEQQDYNLAKVYFLQATQIDNNNSNSYTMLGDCYERMGKLDKAKKYYRQALNLNPNNQSTLNSLAALSYFNGETKEAVRLYKLSINLNEGNHEAQYSLAQCQLGNSNYKEGWKNFESRWFVNRFNSQKFKSNLPKFALNSDKKNLLIWSEQGIGDQVMFLRFLRDVKIFTENLFINIDKRLHSIIKRSYPKIKFISRENKNKFEINSQISLVDLAPLFLKDNSYFSRHKPRYINGENTIKKELKKKLKNKNQLICGISWISKNVEIGINKSISLEMLKPILLIKDFTFIDLQYNDTKIEREKFYSDNGIKISKVDSIDNFNDLNGLASLIDVCDFVVTVSNTTAHLAGALGKNTFLLLPKGKGKLWYWSSQDSRSIWYPSIKIIEQSDPGLWKPVINNLNILLRKYIID